MEYEDAADGVTARDTKPDPNSTLSVSPSSAGFWARLRVDWRRLRNQFVTFARSLQKKGMCQWVEIMRGKSTYIPTSSARALRSSMEGIEVRRYNFCNASS